MMAETQLHSVLLWILYGLWLHGVGSREALRRVLRVYRLAFLGSLLAVLLAVLATRLSQEQLHCPQ